MATMRFAELHDFLSDLKHAGLTDHQLFYIFRSALENQLSVAVQYTLKYTSSAAICIEYRPQRPKRLCNH